MRSYLIHFAVTHLEFRIPELLSVCSAVQCEIELPEEDEERDLERPFMIVKLENDNTAKQIASRCILIKGIYALWAHADTYEDLHKLNQERACNWESYQKDTSFKFIVSAVHHTIPHERVKSTIEGFRYMALKGPIDMKNPQLTVACWEEYWRYGDSSRTRGDGDGKFRRAYLGRLISMDASRSLIDKFNVKKRVYFGNTSMDAEVSLLMANQALATPGSMVYDPFAGTGSMLYTAAHFGALVFGSDVDGRQMRGKDAKAPGIMRAAAQYGVNNRVIGCFTFDVTNHPWRCGNIFDAIVTDPPYGVRAGAKRLGGKLEKGAMRDSPIVLSDGVLAHTKPTYIPPTRPYELSDLAQDLVFLARYLLKPNGRLVFFLPTVSDEYQDVDIPTCDGMELIANSLQDFGKWGRRLVTMVKTASDEGSVPTFEGMKRTNVSSLPADYVPAHRDFRVKYFNRFSKDATS